MTRNDEWRRVVRHGLPDVAGRFAAGADFLGQGAVSGRAAPADAPRGLVDPPEERVLSVEVEADAAEVDFLAGEVARRRRDNSRNIGRRRARLCVLFPSAHQAFGSFCAFRRQKKARHPSIAPGDGAEPGCGFEDVIRPRLVHPIILAHAVSMKHATPWLEFNPIPVRVGWR